MISTKLVDKKDMIFGRALHGLLLLIKDISAGLDSKIRVLINPNICGEVIGMLRQYTEVHYIDYDPHKTILLHQITNNLSLYQEHPTIILFNCVYGDSEIDITALEAVKKNNPNVKIILDACLLSSKNYLKFKNNGVFDALIYSFGYSKFVDLNYGGVLSLQDENLDISGRSDICIPKFNVLDKLKWENYPHHLKSSLDFNELCYHTLSDAQLEHLNRRLFEKVISVEKSRALTRKRLRVFLDRYDEFLLDPNRFDWRLNYVIRDEKIQNEFTSFLKKSGLHYSRHYQNEAVADLHRSNGLVNNIFNVLDDERQTKV